MENIKSIEKGTGEGSTYLEAKMLEAIRKRAAEDLFLTGKTNPVELAKSCAAIAMEFGERCFEAGGDEIINSESYSERKYETFEDYINKKP